MQIGASNISGHENRKLNPGSSWLLKVFTQCFHIKTIFFLALILFFYFFYPIGIYVQIFIEIEIDMTLRRRLSAEAVSHFLRVYSLHSRLISTLSVESLGHLRLDWKIEKRWTRNPLMAWCNFRLLFYLFFYILIIYLYQFYFLILLPFFEIK